MNTLLFECKSQSLSECVVRIVISCKCSEKMTFNMIDYFVNFSFYEVEECAYYEGCERIKSLPSCVRDVDLHGNLY